MYTKLERYLLQNNRCFVVGGDKTSSTSELSCPNMEEREIIGILKESPHIKKMFIGAFKNRKIEERDNQRQRNRAENLTSGIKGK